MSLIGPLLKINTRLQVLASAMTETHKLETAYGAARLQKSKSEAGYRWRALQRDITAMWGTTAALTNRSSEEKA